MYFGKFYYAPLEAVFGDAQIESYRARLQIHPSLEDAMNFHESEPDVADKQILDSWDEIECRDTDDLVVLWYYRKAQMRVTSMALAYADPLRPQWQWALR
ncbi:MAG: hypothetical protein OXN84_12710 [Albidovulum sp.]|nr:hypothetical protein [Albidovulum sp.]